MNRTYYDAESLARGLATFEGRYGMSSEEFYAAHVTDSASVVQIPGFHRHIWASFYRDVRRLSGEDFIESVEQTLELA